MSATEGEIPRSTGRVLDLLEIVLSRGSCNLTDAATQADLTPTTALRHLRALEARAYLERDDNGVFTPGPVMLRIAASLRDSGELDRMVKAAQPLLQHLASSTGESAYLAVSDGRVATYVATAESDRAIRHVGWVGQTVTLDGTAVGKALADQGTVVCRTGAVEPDITAVSLSAGQHGNLAVAISVIGPKHRLGKAQQAAVGKELGISVVELRRAVGIDAQAVAS